MTYEQIAALKEFIRAIVREMAPGGDCPETIEVTDAEYSLWRVLQKDAE